VSNSDYDLGDYIESLPYEGGPGSADEYIANSLLIKRLQLRNEELKDAMIAQGKRYIPATKESHYIGVTQRKNYQYSKKIEKLEADLKAQRAHIAAKKAIEEQHGDATPLDPTMVLSVRGMTQQVLERIKSGDNEVGEEDNEF
jgi:hypothetical protein